MGLSIKVNGHLLDVDCAGGLDVVVEVTGKEKIGPVSVTVTGGGHLYVEGNPERQAAVSLVATYEQDGTSVSLVGWDIGLLGETRRRDEEVELG